MPLSRFHLSSALEMNWSMMTCAGVDEVAELRLPQHQPVGPVEAVAVLEAEHAGLAERAVVDLDLRLVGRQVHERHVGVAVLHVVEQRVAVAEGAAAGVLPGHAHAYAFGHERREGERLGGAPVERALARRHLRALRQQASDLLVDVEVVRQLGLPTQEVGETLARNGRVHLADLGLGSAAVALPVAAQPVLHLDVVLAARFAELLLELRATLDGNRVGFLL